MPTKSTQLILPRHPRWEEFIDRLSGAVDEQPLAGRMNPPHGNPGCAFRLVTGKMPAAAKRYQT